MTSDQPRLISTFLPDGTLEGLRIIELSESSIRAFVIPRLKLADIKNRSELVQPALYFLFSSDTMQGYIGETENFFHRIKNHDQSKLWWNIVVAIISPTNSFEKGDVKYLESIAVERALGGSMQIDNKTTPIRNNIHEFKIHSLQKVLDDTQIVLTSLGYDALSVPEKTEQIWYCKTKKTDAKGVFRGDKFVILAGSILDLEEAPSFEKFFPSDSIRRREIIKSKTTAQKDIAILNENIQFRSPNDAGQFVTGRSINAWTTWKDKSGQTMNEVMRRGE